MPSDGVALAGLVETVGRGDAGESETPIGAGGLGEEFEAVKLALDFAEAGQGLGGEEGESGGGGSGPSGRPRGESILAPLRVEALSPLHVTHISVGDNHSCAMGRLRRRGADGLELDAEVDIQSEDEDGLPEEPVRLVTFGLNAGNVCLQGRAVPQQQVPTLSKLTLAKGAKLALVEAGAGHTAIVV